MWSFPIVFPNFFYPTPHNIRKLDIQDIDLGMKRTADVWVEEGHPPKKAKTEKRCGGALATPAYKNISGILGVTLVPDVFSPEEETYFFKSARGGGEWTQMDGHRTRQYGPVYSPADGSVSSDISVEFPEWLKLAFKNLKDRADLSNDLTHAIITEYKGAETITPRVNSPDFSPGMALLVLGAATVVFFQVNGITRPIHIPRRSLLIIERRAQYRHTYCAPRKNIGAGIFEDHRTYDEDVWARYHSRDYFRTNPRISIAFRFPI